MSSTAEALHHQPAIILNVKDREMTYKCLSPEMKHTMAKTLLSNQNQDYNAQHQIQALYMLCNQRLAQGQRTFFLSYQHTFCSRNIHSKSREWIITHEPMIRSQVKFQLELHHERLQANDNLFTTSS